MRPRREPEQQLETFQVEQERLVDNEHPLVRLGQSIDWSSLEAMLGATYHPTQAHRPSPRG